MLNTKIWKRATIWLCAALLIMAVSACSSATEIVLDATGSENSRVVEPTQTSPPEAVGDDVDGGEEAVAEERPANLPRRHGKRSRLKRWTAG